MDNYMQTIKSRDVSTTQSNNMSLDCSLDINGEYYGMMFLTLHRSFHSAVTVRNVVFTVISSGSNVSKSEVSVDAETFDDLYLAVVNRNVTGILSYFKDKHNVNL